MSDRGPRIANRGVKISLLSVAPGKEVAVAHRLSRAIRAQTHRQPACLLKLFGRYDICAIYDSADYAIGPSASGGIDDIRGGNQILAYPWRSGKRMASAFASRFRDAHVWGLLFFRINETLARQFGARIETVLAGMNVPQDEDVGVSLLGTTGWAELVFVVRGYTFRAVTATLATISQQEVEFYNGQTSAVDLLSAKTFSLLGIDLNLLGSPPYRTLKRTLKETFSTNRGCRPYVTVTCAPQSMVRVGEYGRSHLGAGSSTFGATDCIFLPKRGTTWGQFISRVLTMRQELAGDIYSTSIQISSDLFFNRAGSDNAYVGAGALVRPGLRLTASRMKLFSRWGAIVENRLRNLSFGLSNLLQDPIIGDCFSDLRYAVDSRLPEMLERSDPEDGFSRNTVHQYIEVLGYGAEERVNGAFLSLENVLRTLSPTKGGIQRVLKAAGAVSRSLLSRAGLQWNGFIVSGFQSLGFSSHVEAINLPLDKLFAPQEWWGLFHEVGHIALWDGDLLDIDGQEISDIVSHFTRSTNESLEYLRTKDLLTEACADTFSLYFCYGLDFPLYISNILSYIARKGLLNDSAHINRCFFAFEYWKSCLLHGHSTLPARLDLDAEFDDFYKMVRSRGYRIKKTLIDGNGLQRSYSLLSQAAGVFHKAYKRKCPPFDLKQQLKSTETTNAVQSVMSGVVWYERLSDPTTFILALKKRGNLPFSARIAAILTLWHTALLQEGEISGSRR